MKQKMNRWYRVCLSKLITMLGFGGGALALAGCDDVSPDMYGPMPVMYGSPPVDYKVKVTPDHLQFENNDTTIQEVQVQTEGQWFVKEAASFVTVAPNSGYGYSTMMTVQAEPNDGDAREGIIVVQSVEISEYTDTVFVYQYGKN